MQPRGKPYLLQYINTHTNHCTAVIHTQLSLPTLNIKNSLSAQGMRLPHNWGKEWYHLDHHMSHNCAFIQWLTMRMPATSGYSNKLSKIRNSFSADKIRNLCSTDTMLAEGINLAGNVLVDDGILRYIDTMFS